MTDYSKIRYGRDVPLEMRPKLYDKLNIDSFFESPQLIAQLKEQEEDARRFVDRLLSVVAQHQDDALHRLVFDGGVSLDRLTRWSETGSTRCGFLVDCPSDAQSVEGYKACTISAELTPAADRHDFTVKTTWHGEWSRRCR